jgi:hypothetical protein
MQESLSRPAPAGPGTSLRQLAPSLVVNAVLPWVAFQVLSGRGVPTVPALCLTAIFPLAAVLVSFARSRHADGIGVISLVFIVVGVAASLVSGDVHFVLVKDSFFTGLFGLVFLGSLLGPRPLMFYFGRSFATGGDPARIARWNGLWQYPGFRRVIRIMTAVWGVAYVVEAAVRVVFAFILPPATVLALSPLLALGVTILLIAWTMSYARRSQQRDERLRARG